MRIKSYSPSFIIYFSFRVNKKIQFLVNLTHLPKTNYKCYKLTCRLKHLHNESIYQVYVKGIALFCF